MFDTRKSRYIYIYKDRIKRKEKAEDVGGRGRAREESTRLFRVWNALVIAAHRGGWQWLRSWVRDVTSLQRCGTLTPALTNLGETKISHGQSPTTCRVILTLSLSLSPPPIPIFSDIFSPPATYLTGEMEKFFHFLNLFEFFVSLLLVPKKYIYITTPIYLIELRREIFRAF